MPVNWSKRGSNFRAQKNTASSFPECPSWAPLPVMSMTMGPRWAALLPSPPLLLPTSFHTKLAFWIGTSWSSWSLMEEGNDEGAEPTTDVRCTHISAHSVPYFNFFWPLTQVCHSKLIGSAICFQFEVTKVTLDFVWGQLSKKMVHPF